MTRVSDTGSIRSKIEFFYRLRPHNSPSEHTPHIQTRLCMDPRFVYCVRHLPGTPTGTEGRGMRLFSVLLVHIVGRSKVAKGGY